MEEEVVGVLAEIEVGWDVAMLAVVAWWLEGSA